MFVFCFSFVLPSFKCFWNHLYVYNILRFYDVQGIQTPVEPGTGQKPIQQEAPLGVPSATSLQHLPGHEKKSVLDKFKGNEQYKRPSNIPPQPDSVKVDVD